jgi:hypothetical protein
MNRGESIQCPKCNGTGREQFQEHDGGPWVSDACYHCGNTGYIDYEQARANHVMAMCEYLGWEQEEKVRESRNRDEHGEGYDFGAAENRMDANDYFRCNAENKAHRIAEDLKKLDENSVDQLLAMYDQMQELREQVRVLKTPPYVPTANLDDDHSDIPF